MKFERLKELNKIELKEICEKHYDRKACYFSSLKLEKEDWYYQVYCSWESDLQRLSPEAWSFFRDDLSPYLFNKNSNWAQLVEKINKVKGYNYLHDNIRCEQVSFQKNELEFPCWVGKKNQILYLCDVVTISFSDYDTKKPESIIDKAKNRLINYQSENICQNILFVIIQDHCKSHSEDDLISWYGKIKLYILNLLKADNIMLELGYLNGYNQLLKYG